MDKCVACHFYDRDNSQTATGGIRWGQCRRSAPRLHPVNQKAFMIEGVWPHVRDDDWCGEWKAAAVRGEGRPAADRLGAMLASNAATAAMHPGMVPVRPDLRAAATGAALTAMPTRPAGVAGVSAIGASPVRPANASPRPVGTAPDLGTLRPGGTAD